MCWKMNKPALVMPSMLAALMLCGVLHSDALADYTVAFHNQTKNIRCAFKQVTVDWLNFPQNGNKAYSLTMIYTGEKDIVTVKGEYKCKRLITKVKCWSKHEHNWMPYYNKLPCAGGNVYMKSYGWGGVYTQTSP